MEAQIKNFKKAAQAYNTKPSDHDARAALEEACLGKRVLKLQPGSLVVDIAESAAVLEFALDTSLPGEDDAMTPQELFVQVQEQREADPITGLPLRNGKTPQRPIVDWSGIGLDDREVVAYAVERGETVGSSEVVVYELRGGCAAASPPWLRRSGELAALKAKRVRTSAEDALLLRCKRRLYFVKGEAAQVAIVSPVEIATTSSRSELRQLLDRRLRTDSDFNAFCLDCFPHVYRNFGGGMTRIAKTNDLLTRVDVADILTALRAY